MLHVLGYELLTVDAEAAFEVGERDIASASLNLVAVDLAHPNLTGKIAVVRIVAGKIDRDKFACHHPCPSFKRARVFQAAVNRSAGHAFCRIGHPGVCVTCSIMPDILISIGSPQNGHSFGSSLTTPAPQ